MFKWQNIVSVKKGLASLCLLLYGNLLHAAYTPQSYIERFAPTAIELMREYEIPASILLGVAFLESGYGNSKNARLLKNHFGLVGKNNLRKKGVKYRSHYKEFDTDEDSYRYFCSTIASKPFYPQLKGNVNYKLWLNKIHHGKYAKAKQKWIKRVTQIIRKYNLIRFDVLND